MENYTVDNWNNECDDSGFSSPGLYCDNSSKCYESISGRRGRPKAAMISNLMKEGAESQSGIRCEICNRVFPRDKSLQAHLRVHTGERPYSCDYPGCVRKFKQSGQLKTHQRLHTGERPFLCSADGCKNRFTHANRHCALHPSASLIRCDNFSPYNPETAPSPEIKHWLLRYMTEKRDPKCEKKQRRSESNDDMNDQLNDFDYDIVQSPYNTSPRNELSDMTNLQHSEFEDRMTSHDIRNDIIKTPLDIRNDVLKTPVKDIMRSPMLNITPINYQSSKCLQNNMRYEDVYWSEGDESACKVQMPAWSTPVQPTNRPPVKSLFSDCSSPTLTLSPRKRELPKKRWLRIARKEEESSANLQRPTVLRYLATSLSLNNTSDMPTSPSYYLSSPNQTSHLSSFINSQYDNLSGYSIHSDIVDKHHSDIIDKSIHSNNMDNSLNSYQFISTGSYQFDGQIESCQFETPVESKCIESPVSPTCQCISESSPLLSRLLTNPHSIYCEDDPTPLATPLPHD